MKENFLVTPCLKARVPGATRLFVTDPYVVRILEQNGELPRYDEVITAPATRTTREAFLRDHEFVDRKFQQYVPIVSQRLSELHGARYDPKFWRKALALALLRHVTLCYDLFQRCETYLNPDRHESRVLSERSHFIPLDFNEHRRFFEHSDFGQEQLFSVYCRLFYPGKFEEWDARHEWPASGPAPRRTTNPSLRQWVALLPRRMARRLFRLRSPTVAIINSYFSAENFDRLLFGSRGRIQFIRIPAAVSGDGPADWELRESLARNESHYDRFDRFAFAALRHGMPRAFVEDAPSLISTYQDFFSKYPKLRWTVSEAWIGDMYSSTALAVLAQRHVRHLYNEHNYFAHPFLGNNLKYILPLVDEFATLGWKPEGVPNAVRAASLFSWTDPKAPRGTDGILYISSLPQVRPPEINASYGESGAVNVASYFSFVCTFFGALSAATLKQTTLRLYPPRSAEAMQTYDLRYELREHLPKFRRIDDKAGNARNLIAGSRLVVVDYLSTAYLESLLADVPTILFWNRDAYYMDERHADFFGSLAEAGICQTDPHAAAQLVETIRDAPEEWWNSAPVRAARKKFLSENMGEPAAMIRHLLALA